MCKYDTGVDMRNPYNGDFSKPKKQVSTQNKTLLCIYICGPFLVLRRQPFDSVDYDACFLNKLANTLIVRGSKSNAERGLIPINQAGNCLGNDATGEDKDSVQPDLFSHLPVLAKIEGSADIR